MCARQSFSDVETDGFVSICGAHVHYFSELTIYLSLLWYDNCLTFAAYHAVTCLRCWKSASQKQQMVNHVQSIQCTAHSFRCAVSAGMNGVCRQGLLFWDFRCLEKSNAGCHDSHANTAVSPICNATVLLLTLPGQTCKRVQLGRETSPSVRMLLDCRCTTKQCMTC